MVAQIRNLLVATVAMTGLRCDSPKDATYPLQPDAASIGLSVETFAVDTVSLGDTLGYDLDGKATNKDSSDVCTLVSGAPHVNQVDGVGGIDNSFGSSVVPILKLMVSSADLSGDETAAIQQGQLTLQINIVDLGPDPLQTANGLAAQVFPSGAFSPDAGAPTFDGTTDWPVLSTSLANGTDISTGSTARFDSAYVNHGTFVAGVDSHTVVPLHLVLRGIGFDLLVHEAIITFDHVDDADAANGILAGILDPNELVLTFRRLAGAITPALCGSAFDRVVQQLAQAADIFLDGTNGPGQPCNGISFAIGFHAKRIANPTRVGVAPTIGDPCDGG